MKLDELSDRMSRDALTNVRHLRAVPSEPVPNRPAAPRAAALRALSVAELDALPEPTWLLPDLIPEGAFVVLYGPPGAGKSFVALDWTLAVASGSASLGREATAADVLYIAGEGVTGIRPRVAAWCTSRGIGPDALDRWRLIPEAVNFADDGDVRRLVAAIERQPAPPDVIVLDTLARCMAGAEENSARDVGTVVANIDRVRRVGHDGAGQGTVIALHHNRKGDEELRGSSTLHGAVDVAHFVKPGGAGRFRLVSKKSKDSEPYRTILLGLEVVDRSAVVTVSRDAETVRREPDPTDAAIIRAAETIGETVPVSATRLAEASGVSRSTVNRRLSDLVDMGFLSRRDSPTGARYCPGPAVHVKPEAQR